MRELAKLVLRNSLTKASAIIQENIQTKNPVGDGPMEATGKARKSLVIRHTDEGMQLVSTMPDRKFNYIWTLETGRKPTQTKQAGSPTLRETIREWIDVKGITPDDPKTSKDSLAFLIARKIHREGTKLHRQGGNSGIISAVTNPKYIGENIIEPMQDALRDEFLTQITKDL